MSGTTAPAVSNADLETIVFGDRCVWCEREEPCDCGPFACRCTCGRCMFDAPLPDDGERAEGGER